MAGKCTIDGENKLRAEFWLEVLMGRGHLLDHNTDRGIIL